MDKADQNTAWQGYVRSLLGQGWGVEDIAVKMNCDPQVIRAEVQILRQSGALGRIYRQIRLNSRKAMVAHDG